ncbi:MAG: acyltransferase domain-containing protein [Symploca sp. SIO2G7]|nr:acyltransferase domain-containing protein [Symploca sp. SIO2G7]
MHFEEPNPQIDFANSPFYVNTSLSDWQANGTPRRAGVSSFGIGGTNAHVVLEEAPKVEPSGKSRPWQLLLLSAKTSSALDTATANLSQHLHSDLNLADVAYTLQVGRRAFKHRRMLVCQDIEDAKNALSPLEQKRVLTQLQEPRERPVVFMFSGQGAQYANMAGELYQSEPTFIEQVDRCCELLQPHLELDLRQVLYPSLDQREEASNQLQQTAITQPALFVIEYALAQLWMSWGVNPAAMVGHSIGEYVAATLAGVFSLEDALALVAARGKLMQQLPSGSMLAVPRPETQVQPLLSQELSIAAINGISSCVVSGEKEAVESLEKQLAAQGVECRRLHTSHAFHSPMMEPILESFQERVQQVTLKVPQISYISNVTGTWITPKEATSPSYWATHLRQTVQLASGLQELLKEPARVLLEIGPGRTLTTLAKRHPDKKSEQVVLSSVRHPKEAGSDVEFLLKALGQLWLAGVEVDWSGFYAHEKRHRLPLPTYSFERQRYWIEPANLKEATRPKKKETSKQSDISQWFYIPSWKRLPLPASQLEKPLGNILLFIDECGLGEQLATQLTQLGQKVICVKVGNSFAKQSEGVYTLNPQQPDAYSTLVNELDAVGCFPDIIVHLWSVTLNGYSELTLEQLDQSQDLGLHSLIFTAQALGKHTLGDGFQIIVVSNNLHEVIGDEIISPEKATLLGAIKTIPLEYLKVSCRSVDVIISDNGINVPMKVNKQLIDQLLGELTIKSSNIVTAYRGTHRWGQTFEPIKLEPSTKNTPRLKEEGVYLITGGFGGMGFTIAQYLAETVKAKIILLGRSSFPPRQQWEDWLANHNEEDSICRKIRKVQSLEEVGAEVLVISANVGNFPQMKTALIKAQKRFGQINGVFHTAAVVDYEGIIQNRTKEMTESVLNSKVRGTLVIDQLLDDVELDFFILFSSVGNIFYQLKFGQVGYNAANEFLDLFAYYKQNSKPNTFTVTINWDDWEEVGMSVEARKKKKNTIDMPMPTISLPSMSPSEGIEVLLRILGSSFPSLSRVIISIENISETIEYISKTIEYISQFQFIETSKYPRPELSCTYIAPRNETEQKLANIWQNLFGIEQVGIHDNFFELGGDSLLAIQVIFQIHQTLHIELPVNSMFEKSTVAEIAQYIEKIHDTIQQLQAPISVELGEATEIEL